ncbi:putative epoxide hydrolase [Colletotrichum trifolii]|uniref:Putative epoxide hydrolase n=1 Tax=Colletotrichum trifolii TaxID=5466 RepID=A0A4R8QQC2_COLTR|nr:putative epoxide hydrolase [Colletotrichum trifolii]
MDRYTKQDTQPISEAPAFFMTGFGYSVMHATKPGTIGLTVAAKLPWLDITDGLTGAPGSVLCTEPGADVPLPLDTILATVTLNWVTVTYPRCIYSNRCPASGSLRETKPFGVSNFHANSSLRLAPGSSRRSPSSFPTRTTRRQGGHFPALEEPESMLSPVRKSSTKRSYLMI